MTSLLVFWEPVRPPLVSRNIKTDRRARSVTRDRGAGKGLKTEGLGTETAIATAIVTVIDELATESGGAMKSKQHPTRTTTTMSRRLLRRLMPLAARTTRHPLVHHRPVQAALRSIRATQR